MAGRMTEWVPKEHILLKAHKPSSKEEVRDNEIVHDREILVMTI